jgi:hypothetical protein
MSRKLIVRLKGGLGNQLFCYATARRLAWFNNAELVLDTVTGFKYDVAYRRTYALSAFDLPARLATAAERMEPLGRIRRLIARKVSQNKQLEHRRFIQQVGVDFDPNILNLRLQKGTTYFDAFGQSERYFSDIRELLLKDLAMSPPDDEYNQAMTKKIEDCLSVAVHVRWFDAGDSAHSSNTSCAYYAQAIRQFLVNLGHAHFFIFSDRPDQTEALLAPLINGHSCTVVRQNVLSGNAEADFWLMCQCRHFIIGNSTYAWWAAWLREQNHEGTHIFAPSQNIDPEHSVTAWGFPGLLPERWAIL